MAKFLGIDYGLSRIGLAVSDPDGRIAFPLATLCFQNYGTRGAVLDALAQRAIYEKADALAIGLPLWEDGSENLTCRQIRNATAKIKRRLNLPVYFMPETLSTHEARAKLLDAGTRGKKLKDCLDRQAACQILQSFLALPDEMRIRA